MVEKTPESKNMATRRVLSNILFKYVGQEIDEESLIDLVNNALTEGGRKPIKPCTIQNTLEILFVPTGTIFRNNGRIIIRQDFEPCPDPLRQSPTLFDNPYTGPLFIDIGGQNATHSYLETGQKDEPLK